MTHKQRPLLILVVEDHEHRVRRFEGWSPPGFRLLWARSAGVAIGMIKRDPGRVYDGIMLDHDLTDQNITDHDRLFNGRDVVKGVIQHIDDDVPVFVHSANVSGGPHMRHTLEGAGFDVEQLAMGSVTANRYRSWLEKVRQAHWEAHEDDD